MLTKNEREQWVSFDTTEGNSQVKRPSWAREHYTTLLVILAFIVFSIAIYFLSSLLGDVEAYGYLGVFLISVMASAVIVVPIPAIAVVLAWGQC